LKIRRAEMGAAPAAKSKIDPLFARIKTWAERLSVLDKIWNAGAKVLDHAGKANSLLEYMPHL
jgi:hypothetical protein